MNYIQKSILSLSAVVAMICTSCGTPKNITYFQQSMQGSVTNITPQHEITLRPGDRVQILVSSKNEQLAKIFNKVVQMSGSNDAQQLRGYTLDNQGNIEFPLLGPVHIAGMTRQAAEAFIQEELRARNLANDAVVTMEFNNLTFDVLGGVKNPGRYNINKDQVTLLDAISEAGDLLITGERTNVRVFRQENNQEKTYEIDLTSARSTFESPAYYIQQGDVVVVEHNDMMKRSSRTSGNLVQTWSFWTSLVSMAITIAVLVVK